MSRTTEPSSRLQYELMQFIHQLGDAPVGEELEGVCRRAWKQLRLDQPGADSIPFADFRQAFNATLTRCPELRSRPAA